MALNPVAYTEHVVRSFLRYQRTAYPFADPRLHAQMRDLLSLDETRRSPLLKGPYVTLSRPSTRSSATDCTPICASASRTTSATSAATRNGPCAR